MRNCLRHHFNLIDMHPKLAVLQNTFQHSALTRVNDPRLDRHAIELWLKRDDLIDPIISGNKWRKLKYSLEHALTLNADTLISMGGAYSNHLHALAFTGKQLGLKTKGFIRGEATTPLNPTLQDLLDWGMTLEFVSRSNYRTLRSYQQWQALPGLTAGQYWLPEGGASTYALQGLAEIPGEITLKYDYLCVPCGTGTTLAGLLTQNLRPAKILGFAALKNATFLNTEMQQLLTVPALNEWSINQNYHCGGFARVNAELIDFINRFEHVTNIPLDPVYTGKMLYGLYDLIEQGYFKPGERLIAIHTGGLQGRRSGLGKAAYNPETGSGGV